MNTPLTPQDVEKAWRDQVQACDHCETSGTEKAYREMEMATQHAINVQRQYANQYERQYPILSFAENRPKHDPFYCDHRNAVMTYNEADGTLYHCPDCDALLAIDQAGEWEIVKIEDEIPF